MITYKVIIGLVMVRGQRTVIAKQRKVSALVYEELLRQIKERKWAEGRKLPSENELRLEMGVSASVSVKRCKAHGIGNRGDLTRGGSLLVTSDTIRTSCSYVHDHQELPGRSEYRMVMEVGAI